MNISLHTNLGYLNFEKPKLYYPGQLLTIIKCPNCDEFLEGNVSININNKKYEYILICNNCNNNF